MIAWLLTWWWQGLAVAVAVAAALNALPNVNAAMRYRFWCGALVAVAWLGLAGGAVVEPACAGGLALCRQEAEPVFHVQEAPGRLVTVAFGVWAAMAGLALFGLLRSLHGMFALRDQCRPFPASLEEQLPLWQEAKSRGRTAALALCDSVSGATVFGLHNPCIALPASLVASLTPDELDLVVLHEHAHVQRRDDWAALVQALLTPVLWMHPAAWFVIRSMAFEREAACDERVVARTGMPKDYARCLARAAEVRVRSTPPQLLAPALFSVPSGLARRVDRVLARQARGHRRPSQALVPVAACVLVLFAAHIRHVPLVGEVIHMALPEVMSPAIAMGVSEGFVPFNALDVVGASVTVPRRSRTTKPLATAGPALEAQAVPSETTESGPIGPPNVDGVRPPLEGRAFHGTYQTPEPAPESAPQTPWQRMGVAGGKIGQTAGQAGVGVANAFARAGVSLAKRF